jgi:hypothetical protein
MARKADLRVQRTGTVINATSKRMEERLIVAGAVHTILLCAVLSILFANFYVDSNLIIQ